MKPWQTSMFSSCYWQRLRKRKGKKIEGKEKIFTKSNRKISEVSYPLAASGGNEEGSALQRADLGCLLSWQNWFHAASENMPAPASAWESQSLCNSALSDIPRNRCPKEKSLGITKCFVIAFPCACRKLSHNRWSQTDTSWLSLLQIISYVKTTSA